jgi:hypothetical protein
MTIMYSSFYSHESLRLKIYSQEIIEAPRIKMRRIFQVRLLSIIEVRSLTPQQATGNALAVPVHQSYMIIAYFGFWLQAPEF